ncbi:MAG: hypothetical protein RIF46_13555 [Cyclobacteriaceae bacterium]
MDQKESLLSALAEHKIRLGSITGNCVYTDDNFCVELKEGNNFKLSRGGYVIQSFSDLNKMCELIIKG